ncbi:Hypothetical protein NTJ_06939 [Nesidiocoris tenuis]|uniref:Secreted protein n=1 Tax=Nesidiocoris tenuis TaxID=355587 RepID=A0ABN7API3_9HEMI|nr:Hypothetical protein NTJ_06939 [Nesidiocoris tenuis]
MPPFAYSVFWPWKDCVPALGPHSRPARLPPLFFRPPSPDETKHVHLTWFLLALSFGLRGVATAREASVAH